MKKPVLFLLQAFLFFSLSGNPVDLQRASIVATNWLSHQLALKGQYPDVQMGDHYIHQLGEHVIYYVFNFEPEGFVIVAGNDAFTPILGYNTSGTTSPGAFPPNLASFFESYEEAILEMHVKNISCPKTLETWMRMDANDMPAPKSESFVEPLLHTQWGQGIGWNTFCPEDTLGPGGHVLVGCVAITMGQIAKYFNYPEQGTGSHEYVHPTYGLQQANFGEATYDWNDMPNTIGTPSTAEMLYHMGVSVEMLYGPDLSLTFSHMVRDAMTSFFGYSFDAEFVIRGNYEYEAWITLLKSHLDNNIPLYYRGTDPRPSGHAFNCDGYDVNDLFHFNWGWSGFFDGYFHIDSIRFSGGQATITNLYPANMVTPPLDGQGTPETPYRISSLQNLLWIASDPERWGYDYIQTRDIDASATQFWNSGAGWNPIGYFNSETDTEPFTGSYNGNGFVIDGLYINRPQQDNVGLFGYTDGSLIKNLGITNANITGKDNVGALVGVNYCFALVEKCYSSGVVYGQESVGGLVGVNSVAEISHSYNMAQVNGSGYCTGGVAGMSVNAEIKESWNGGQVNGHDSAGGVVGVSYYSPILNSYNRGAVTGYESVGGLVGFNLMSDITYSFSTGAVSAQLSAGGLVGEGWGGNVSNSYWNTETSNQAFSQGGLGRNTEQMTFPAHTNTYVGWDFGQIWSINDLLNESYPFLQNTPGKYDLKLEGVAGDGYVQLNWQYDARSSDDNHLHETIVWKNNHKKINQSKGNFQGFNIYRNHELINTEPTLETEYLDLDVANEVSYIYYISMDFGDFETPFSNFLVLSPYFPFPRRLEAHGGMGHVTLHWEPASINLDDVELPRNGLENNTAKVSVLLGYNIYRNNLLVNQEPVTDTLFVDQSVTNNVSYRYRVTAAFSNGESRFTNMAEATPSMPRPTNLTAVADNTAITLQWDAPVTDGKHSNPETLDNSSLMGYNIYRNNILINNEVVTNLTFFDISPPPYQNHAYRVKAVYPADESIFSNTANAILNSGVGPSYGDGSQQDPYQIATLENLVWIAEDQMRWNYHYVQTENISAFSTRNWFDGAGWVPIGSSNHRFTGFYDGQGHFIDALFISGRNNLGLFGAVGQHDSVNVARIANLGVTNIELTGTRTVGAIAGYASMVAIENCYTTGYVKGLTNVGGLIGSGGTGLNISNGFNSARIDNVPGVISIFGGIIGSCINCQIDNSFNFGEIVGWEKAGGIAGEASNLILSNSYGAGSIQGNKHLGGLIGYSWRNCSIFNSFSYGHIQSYSTDVGGLLGFSRDSDFFENSYWDMEASEQSSCNGGLGRTTEQMTSPYDPETYVEWDFDEIWAEDTDHALNNGYPYLQWQVFYIDPVLMTHGANNSGKSTTTLFASIVFTGQSGITAHGFCWNTSGNPTISDNHSNEGAAVSAGIFSSGLSGLQHETTYYARAYAINDNGVTYGNEVTFQTQTQGVEQFSFIINTSGNGLVNVNGNEYTGELFFEQGATLHLEAIAAEGWAFNHWSGHTEYIDDPENASANITMPAADVSLTASFDPETGVTIAGIPRLIVYPNPASQFVTVTITGYAMGQGKIGLFNLHGKRVYELSLMGDGDLTQTIDVSTLDPGVYILVIRSEHFTKTVKLVLGL